MFTNSIDTHSHFQKLTLMILRSMNIQLFLSVLGVILNFTFMGWTADIPESPLPLDPGFAGRHDHAEQIRGSMV